MNDKQQLYNQLLQEFKYYNSDHDLQLAPIPNERVVQAIELCLCSLNEPEWIHLLASILYQRSKIIPEELILRIIVALEAIKGKQKKIAVITLGHLAIGLKNSTLLSRIFSYIRNCIQASEFLANSFKSLEYIIYENPKMANEIILTLLGCIQDEICKNSMPGTLGMGSRTESDSDISEWDSKRVKMRSDWKIQYHALGCLDALVKQCPKQMHPQWAKFLPPSAIFEKSLFQIISAHPHENCRIAASKVIISFFTDSSKYCSIAVNDTKLSSFTSLSQSLADQITATIEYLLKAIKIEESQPVLNHLYTALSVMARNCPLKNLDDKVIRTTFSFLIDRLKSHSREYNSQQLDCLAALLEPLEMKSYSIYLEGAMIIIPNFVNEKATLDRISLLNLISSISVHSPCLVWKEWSTISPFIDECFKAKEGTVVLAALKAMEQFCHSSIDEDTKVDLPFDWWHLFLQTLATLWNSSFYAIRSVCCQILNHIPNTIFKNLPERLQVLLIVSGLSFSADEHPDVRAAACSTIGMWISNDNIDQDSDLQEIITSVVPICNDENLKVRTRAFWMLGNLTDKLHGRKSNSSFLSDEDMMTLLQLTIKGCRDNDKVRSHALRSFGFIAQLMKPQMVNHSRHVLTDAVSILLKNCNTGSFKVRWNACHCIRHLLGNPGFPMGMNVIYTNQLLTNLCQITLKSYNFKVKTGAIMALYTPTSLLSYETEEKSSSEMIYYILCTIVSSMETVDQALARLTFEEQKHLKQYLDAILDSISHFKKIVPWNNNFVTIESQILKLHQQIIEPQKSNFDSTGN